jgi:lipopolysaccharide/colanic/teichoic acid biosynthesis glycosyltransferase
MVKIRREILESSRDLRWPAGPAVASPGSIQAARAVAVRPRPRWALAAKRCMDVVGASVGLILLAPLGLLIALSVLLVDGWPVFYRWEVLGEEARPFTGYKFRTMVRHADSLRSDVLHRNEMRGPVFKIRADPRLTRLGALLRRASLDELPQLWSVLKGDMSLVGPRPLYPHEYAEATPQQRRKLSVKPGITCLWQVSGRNHIDSFEDWIRLDLAYIETWSLRLDMKILVQTIPVVLTGKGAW